VSNETLRTQNTYLKALLERAADNTAERDIAERIQAVLTGELHHRMKNMLAMVTAIVRQSIRASDNLEAAERAIETRLIAMARAHDLLLKADLATARLTRVVADAIEQHSAAISRIGVEGDELDIVADAIVPMTLMLNELCTNATKYGSLSSSSGEVSLTWTRNISEETMTFRWAERGGPAVTPPGRRSLGTRLIEDALPRQLGGQGRLMFPVSGVEFELVIPTASLMAQSAI
jgi:two-component sensor histidine kinase